MNQRTTFLQDCKHNILAKWTPTMNCPPRFAHKENALENYASCVKWIHAFSNGEYLHIASIRCIITNDLLAISSILQRALHTPSRVTLNIQLKSINNEIIMKTAFCESRPQNRTKKQNVDKMCVTMGRGKNSIYIFPMVPLAPVSYSLTCERRRALQMHTRKHNLLNITHGSFFMAHAGLCVCRPQHLLRC